MALKTRNPIVFAFHPSAQRCSMEAARIVRDAAVTAGAPEHCVQWIATHTSVSNNVSAAHLPNVKRVSTRRNNLQCFRVPPKIGFAAAGGTSAVVSTDATNAKPTTS
jgi:hypothetical protein